MYSLEVWSSLISCRVVGASGNPEDVRKKAEDLAKTSLDWVETAPGKWEAKGLSGSRYIVIKHQRGW